MSSHEMLLKQRREIAQVYASLRNYICDASPDSYEKWMITRARLEAMCDDLLPVMIEIEKIAEMLGSENIKYYIELIAKLRNLNPLVQIEDDLAGAYCHSIWVVEGTVLKLPEKYRYNGANDLIMEIRENDYFYALEVFFL